MNDKNFQILEILKTLLKITTKQILNNKTFSYQYSYLNHMLKGSKVSFCTFDLLKTNSLSNNELVP